jgi:hypothetical protein
MPSEERAWPTQAYFYARRRSQQVTKLVPALVDGIALGLFDRERLAAIDAEYYSQHTAYVDETYNRRGLWAWEQAALDRHFRPGSRIAVTAAGGGREVWALRAQGFDAIGYECHAMLAEAARRLLADAGLGGDVRPQPRDRWPADGERFDGVIVGWTSYMLMPGRARRLTFLHDVRAHVDAGAPVLLSFFSRTTPSLYLRGVYRIAKPLRRLRGAEPPDIGDALKPNFVHFFDESQARGEVEEAGFEVVDYGAGDYGWLVARAS